MTRAVPDWLATAARDTPWSALHVCVAGIGVTGFAVADALLQLGADVDVVDAATGERVRERAEVLEVLGARVGLGPDAAATLPAQSQLVVVSPGWHPDAPLVAQALGTGVPVWSEVELAWRLRDPVRPAPWLALTGTNGKTTTVHMLDAMLRAAGLRSAAVGNVGDPLVSAVLHPDPYDALALELSSLQLHWTHGMSAHAAAVLNLAPDHLDWHGSMAAYAADKGRIYTRCQVACVYNVADAVTEQLVRDADVVEGCRAVGFTLGVPSVGMLGVVDGILADRAFVEQRQDSAAELAGVEDIGLPGPHNVANALAAAALARSLGVPPRAVRDGLRGFVPDPHRIATVATGGGVRYVDDSKATNGHAALASLSAFRDVVWVAGGLAKGAIFDDLVVAVRDRLRAVVLLGRDRALLAEALARHAPEVRVVEVQAPETGQVGGAEVMERVVGVAAGLAQPGDTVLLAPACASMDQFQDYGARGDAFAAAVRRLPGDAG